MSSQLGYQELIDKLVKSVDANPDDVNELFK
jgi:hypothetical protein